MAKLNGLQIGNVNGRVRSLVLELGLNDVAVIPVVEKIGKTWDKMRLVFHFIEESLLALSNEKHAKYIAFRKTTSNIFGQHQALMSALKNDFQKLLLECMDSPPRTDEEIKWFIDTVDKYLGSNEAYLEEKKKSG